jgi:D-lactate dehydrogenase (cytochrome)
MLLVQLEVPGEVDAALERFGQVLVACGVDADPRVAMPDDRAGAARLFELRESVPASVNAIVAAAKAREHPDIEKTAGDLVVPFERLGDALTMYRRVFEQRQLPYAIWGHVSDGNLHPNVVPRSLEQVEQGREAVLEMARNVVAMGGAPLAEHGVGRSALKQRLLLELYGDRGIEEMRRVKRALDPDWKFAPGVLFPQE